MDYPIFMVRNSSGRLVYTGYSDRLPKHYAKDIDPVLDVILQHGFAKANGYYFTLRS